MKISADGFVEIPEEIRIRLNLTPNAEIEFEIFSSERMRR